MAGVWGVRSCTKNEAERQIDRVQLLLRRQLWGLVPREQPVQAIRGESVQLRGEALKSNEPNACHLRGLETRRTSRRNESGSKQAKTRRVMQKSLSHSVFIWK